MSERRDRDEFDTLFDNMTEVPFSADLRARILKEAESEYAALPAPAVRRRRHRRWSTAIGGMAAAVVLVVGVLVSHGLKNAPWNPLSSANRAGVVKGELGLRVAPLRVDRIWTSNLPGFPANSVVFAELTNTSSQPITKADVVGVLAFTNTGGSPLTSNWLTFVNGPDAAVQPGQTIIWTFHPVGAPTNTALALTERPQLAFYSTQLADPANASVIWHISPAVVSSIEVVPRQSWGIGQSIGVTAFVSNPTREPITLNSLLAVIWFDGSATGSFTNTQLRFISHLHSESGETVVEPGKSIAIYCDVIGSADSDFFSTTPHITLIEQR